MTPMAFPPALPSTEPRNDQTPAVGAHAKDHNDTATALSAIVARLTGTGGRVTIGEGALAALPDNYVIATGGTAIALGYQAMNAMTQVQKSIAIGPGAQAESLISRDNIAVGEDTLRRVQAGSAAYSQADKSGTRNIAIGGLASAFLTTGYNNVAIGRNAGGCQVSGLGLTAIGANAVGGYAPIGLSGVIENRAPLGTPGQVIRTTAVGATALNRSTAANNVAVGGDALALSKKSDNNVAVGAHAMAALDTGTGYAGGVYTDLNIPGTYDHAGTVVTITATAHGYAAGDVAYLRLLDGASATFQTDIALANVATVPDVNTFTVAHPVSRTATGTASVLGRETAVQQPKNEDNVAVGANALDDATTGVKNVAIGSATMGAASTASWATAVGKSALGLATSVSRSAVVGYNAGGNLTGAQDGVTALGSSALSLNIDGTAMTAGYFNITALGYDTRVSGANQVQLGNSATTTYVYGTVQNRSDARDKADVRDTVLGLDFIEALRPVDYRWDMREDYAEVDEATGEVTVHPKDGTRKRSRFHHGLIAQDVAALVEGTGVDFGGLQDHAKAGGSDVLSIGYDELIAPLIKAVQQLSARVAELEAAQA